MEESAESEKKQAPKQEFQLDVPSELLMEDSTRKLGQTMNFGKLNLESKGDLLATQTINQQAKQSLSQTQRFDRN